MRLFPHHARSVPADERGSIAVLSAAVMAVVVVFVGVVIDLGSVTEGRRSLQAATDSAALAASLDLSRANSIAVQVIKDQGFPASTVKSVATGVYTPDPELPAHERFVPLSGPGANAVEVRTQTPASLFFYGVIGAKDHVAVAATARATHLKEAGFTAGTGLASTDEGLLDSVLGALLDSSIDLSVMDYEGLLGARVNLLQALDALAVRLDATAGSYEELLAMEASVGEIVDAALAVTGDADARAALDKLRSQSGMGERLTLRHLFDLGHWEAQPVGAGDNITARHATVDLYHLLVLSAQAANGGHLLEFPLGVSVPGVAEIDLALALVEPAQAAPRIGLGPEGTSIHTAQTRLLLDVKLLPLALLGGSAVRVPLYVEVAQGEAKAAAIDCGSDPAADGSVAIDARSGPAGLHIGALDTALMTNFSQPVSLSPATILHVPLLLKVTARADATAGASDWRRLSFSQDDINGAVVKTVASEEILTGLLASLGESLVLDAQVLGLLLVPLSSILDPLEEAVILLLTNIEPLLDSLLRALGLRVGTIDVKVGGMRCGVAAMVQ